MILLDQKHPTMPPIGVASGVTKSMENSKFRHFLFKFCSLLLMTVLLMVFALWSTITIV